MATKIEKRNHSDGGLDVRVVGGGADHTLVLLPGDDRTGLADKIVEVARLAYRAGRQDEAAIRAAAMAGLMNGVPIA